MPKKMLRLEKFAEEILGIELTQEQKRILKAIEKPVFVKVAYVRGKQLKLPFKEKILI